MRRLVSYEAELYQPFHTNIYDIDYGNAFVGHYNAGDIQHQGHNAYSNFNNLYWKETKNFANGCSSHLLGASYADGNLAL